MKRLILWSAAATVLLGTTATYAHYVYEQAVTEDFGDGRCLWGRAEISHGGQAGYLKTTVKAKERFGAGDPATWDCQAGWVQPRNRFLLKSILYKYVGDRPGANNGWAICRDYEWFTNSSSEGTGLEQREDYGNGSPPCGNGWYGTFTMHGMKFNGDWYPDPVQESAIWSGPHWLPDD